MDVIVILQILLKFLHCSITKAMSDNSNILIPVDLFLVFSPLP